MGARKSTRGEQGRRRSGRSLGRKPPSLTPRKTVLIVCEGSRTEPNYFNAIRKQKKLATVVVNVIGGDEAGTHPKNIVEHAKKKQDQARVNRDEYDYVWCVFDRDIHKRIDQAFVQARDLEFSVTFSNPCFELWYLLHFQDQGAELERGKAKELLKQHLPGYSKASDDTYESLASMTNKAVERAKKLRHRHQIVGDTTCTRESPNPSTWVDQLIEQLDELYGPKPAATPQER